MQISRYLPFLALISIGYLAASPAQAQAQPAKVTAAEILQRHSLKLPNERAAAVQALKTFQQDRKKMGERRARQLGRPTRTVRQDGTVQEVVDLDEKTNQPVLLTTHNANAAISVGSDKLRTQHNLRGAGTVVGIWDGGAVRSTHQEFLWSNASGTRVSVRDGSLTNDHATHVGGTIAAGISPTAMGMAPSAFLDSYDWTDDLSEMTSRAATQQNQTDKLLISNHSYGYVRGWNWNGSRYVWSGTSGNNSSSIETNFGMYNAQSRAIDSIAFDAPYYLMFWSAGNDRNNNPTTGSTVTIGGASTTYSPANHPPGDGVYRGGFETISDNAIAKNILTVGATNDAVTGGARDISKASLTSFTAWGPTDDGRIKPDLVANGASLYSTLGSGNTAYGVYSGTSMSAPSAAGTAVLLVEQYKELFPGNEMKASTLKGLLIHTADDLGNTGPDYKTGWGIINSEEAYSLISDHAANPSKRRMMEKKLTTSDISHTEHIAWGYSGPLKITICWTDPEGASTFYSDSRVSRLVNNLNLKIIGPDSTEHQPYVMPFVGTWTQESMNSPVITGVNNTDNVEQVYIEYPQPGTYQVVVSYSGTLTGGEQSYSLLVSGSDANTPPVISGLSGTSIEEDSMPEGILFNVTDNETPLDLLYVSAISSNTSLVPETGINITREAGSARRLNVFPLPNAYGTSTITVTAVDGAMQSQVSFLLTVTPVNDPPSISPIASTSINTGTSSEPLEFTIGDVDNDTSSLYLSASSSNQALVPEGSITFSGSGTNRASFITPSPGMEGSSTITVTVSDGELSSQTNFLVTVINPNPSFDQWIGVHQGLTDTSFHEDADGDGTTNGFEYFFGLNPLSSDNEIVTRQELLVEYVAFDYRRSKYIKDIGHTVKWSNSPDQVASWTPAGISESIISSDTNNEWRRVLIPWTGENIFVRIELTLE